MRFLDLLLTEQICINNEYYLKYVDLIQDNISTQKQKYITQRHHIVPRKYFELISVLDKSIINSSENLVNLTFQDHIRAHYYLALCSNSKFKEKSLDAVFRCICNKKQKTYKKDFEFPSDVDLDILQELYSKKKHLKSIHELGKKLINKDGIENYVYDLDKLDEYLKSGWTLGPIHKRCWIHKEDIQKMISIEELNQFLDAGWFRGFSDNRKLHNANKIIIHKDEEERHVSEDCLADFLNGGWELGRPDHLVKSNQTNKKGKIYINKNGTKKVINKYELNDYLKEGWKRGSGEQYIELFLGNKFTRVLSTDIEKLDNYLSEGWKRGRPEYIGKKHSKSMKGNIPWNKGKKCHEETKQKQKTTLANTIKSGKYIPHKQSDTVRKSIGDKKRGKICISKDKIIKYIDKKDQDLYINNGWFLGRKSE